MPRPTLSVVCRTAAAGARPAAILALFRGVADEIVVAVDDRAEPAARASVGAVADRVLVYPFLDPVDRALPWLAAESRGDWIFSVDDDEIPSVDLIEALPELIADDSVAHCSVPVRWLWPDSSTYLDEWPWRPHYAARLLRADPRLIRFSDEMHRSILTAGPGRFLQLPLWHADTVLRSFEERRAKAARYERARPGMRIAGRALNYAFYVPELRREPVLAPVPEAERERIDAVLNAGPQAGAPGAVVETASRERIDRWWPRTDPDAQAGRLELLDRPPTLSAGESRTLDVRVDNAGAATWPWGVDGVPEVRVGSRWYDAAVAELPELEIHTPLSAPLGPGEQATLPVHIRAPETPGRYRIRLDLIQQHVRWFEVGVELELEVVPQRRIAVVGDDEAVAGVAGVLAELPELEIVRLRRSASAAPEGYPQAPDLRAYLFDRAPGGRVGLAAALLWRRLRLRIGPTPPRATEAIAALSGAELLVVAGPDGPDERRERFARDTLVRVARMHGLTVAESRDPEELASLRRRD